MRPVRHVQARDGAAVMSRGDGDESVDGTSRVEPYLNVPGSCLVLLTCRDDRIPSLISSAWTTELIVNVFRTESPRSMRECNATSIQQPALMEKVTR